MTKETIGQSDIVAICLNMAYVPDEVLEAFSFELIP